LLVYFVYLSIKVLPSLYFNKYSMELFIRKFFYVASIGFSGLALPNI
jgi:hypothetical protein